MTLTYDFDGDSFDYKIDSSEVDSYLSEQDDAALAECAEEAFSNMSEQDRSNIITELINEGDISLLTKHQEGTNVKYSVNWNRALETDKDWVLDIVKDNLEFFQDDMEDYFHRDAAEAYDDAESYRRDPYGYNGVNERDFY